MNVDLSQNGCRSLLKALSLLTPSVLCESFVRRTFYAVWSFGLKKALLRFLPPNKHTHSNSLSKYVFFYISLSFLCFSSQLQRKCCVSLAFQVFWTNFIHSMDFHTLSTYFLYFDHILIISLHCHAFSLFPHKFYFLACFWCHYLVLRWF